MLWWHVTWRDHQTYLFYSLAITIGYKFEKNLQECHDNVLRVMLQLWTGILNKTEATFVKLGKEIFLVNYCMYMQYLTWCPFLHLFFHSNTNHSLRYFPYTYRHSSRSIHKRGLPHSNMVLPLFSADKLTVAEEVDKIISTEISDMATDPLAYETAVRTMIHGLWGPISPNSPWMVNKRCSLPITIL